MENLVKAHILIMLRSWKVHLFFVAIIILISIVVYSYLRNDFVLLDQKVPVINIDLEMGWIEVLLDDVAEEQTFDVVYWNNIDACKLREPCWQHFQTKNTSFKVEGDFPDFLLVLPTIYDNNVFKAALLYKHLNSKDKSRVYDVTEFGAIGDGVTDDTAAFQNAMEKAQGGGIVRVPAGQYPIKRVEVFSDTILIGEGKNSVLMHAAEDLDEHPKTSIMLTNGASNIVWKDLHFNGNISAHLWTGGRPGNANSELLDLKCGQNILIINNYFSEALAGEAIDLDGTNCSSNYFIVGNYIDMTAQERTGEGILSRGHGHVVSNNIVIGSGSGHRAAIGVDSGGSSNFIINNLVVNSVRAFDIRSVREKSAPHVFLNNIMLGRFEEESVFDGLQANDL